jgi:hypothetical protein
LGVRARFLSCPEIDHRELLEETNKSLINANTATKTLANETKSYYKQLQCASWVIAAVTILNMSAVVFTSMTKGGDKKEGIQRSPNTPPQQTKQTLKSQI